MKVFIFSEGDDTGGVGIAIKRAFDRRASRGWEVRAMRGTNNFIDYPYDLSWDPEVFRQMWEWADVIHAMEKVENFLPFFNPPHKAVVAHHHGTVYRDNHVGWIPFAKERGIIQLVSTPDLTLFDPANIWLPNPIDIDLMRHIRSQYRPSDQRPFTVVHTPTQRWAKYTDSFLSSFQWLKGQRPGSELLLVEGKTWTVSITEKAKAHISYDQVRDGYGLSGIEAAAMGLPVIAGYTDPQIRAAVLPLLGGDFPFIESDLPNLGQTMLNLASDPRYFRESAQRGEAFVHDHHDERVTVKALKEIWTRARDSFIDDDEPWA